MNTNVLKTASEYTGPIVLGAGIAVMAVGVFTGSHGGRAQAAPSPTVTVTAPSRVVTVSPAPSPTPRPAVTLVADRRSGADPGSGQQATPGGSGGASSDRVSAEQAPPSPSRTAFPSSSCDGRVVRLVLGVLPDCAVTAGGGSR